jgi:predicted dehydrogenase
VVILAGRNHTKLETIARLTQAGLHVLADKPWLTDSQQLPYLAQVTAGDRLAMDIMTIRHAITARLIHQVISVPELFGGFAPHDRAVPAIAIASSHHLYKTVNGRPLRRPPWYYDTTVQGDGMVDIQSHMVEQAQWWVVGNDPCDIERDVVLESARRWSTPVPPDLFQASTGLSDYPASLRSSVQDGVLEYACNGEICYRLRGVCIRQTVDWRQWEPEGAGDLHNVTVRGNRCQVMIRQGADTQYRAEVHLKPVAGENLEPILRAQLDHWQVGFPGLSFVPSAIGFRFVVPPELERGHESHFALVLNRFLDYLEQGHWPEALPARIRMRYTLLAQARELALRLDK